MNARSAAAFGVALATFLVVAALLTGLLADRIAFSAFVGLPSGLVAGAAAGIAAWARFWRYPRARPALLGVAAFGYALVAAAAVSYAVPPARGFVSVGTAVPFGVACAVAASLLARRYGEQIA